eukprot:4508286-Pyramimonas_sp.AAC.1
MLARHASANSLGSRTAPDLRRHGCFLSRVAPMLPGPGNGLPSENRGRIASLRFVSVSPLR